jgi:hypothetical protein
MEEALRIIPRDHRVLSGAVGIWLRQIYENLFTYCESRLSEDLLVETMRSYKVFLISWNAVGSEEDPEILRRSTRDIPRGLQKRRYATALLPLEIKFYKSPNLRLNPARARIMSRR